MKKLKFTFKNAAGEELAGLLELPENPKAFALLAHCFTCGKDLKGAARIARKLTENAIAVLRFDFTGLGNSEGDFSNTNFSSNTVISALIRQARELPAELYKTLTWDRGAEMTSHTRFTVATDIQIYFCDPQSPWQRGSNENTNRLLRQYFPKGTDLSVHSQQRLNSVARQLNERPRKTLDYESPAERFNKCVASIG